MTKGLLPNARRISAFGVSPTSSATRRSQPYSTVHACETSLQFLFSSSPAAQEKLQSMVRIEGKKKNLLTQVDFKG